MVFLVSLVFLSSLVVLASKQTSKQVTKQTSKQRQPSAKLPVNRFSIGIHIENIFQKKKSEARSAELFYKKVYLRGGAKGTGWQFGADLRGGAEGVRLSRNFGDLLGNRNKFT